MREVTVFVDGVAYVVPWNWTALSAIALSQGGGIPVCRSSVLGESRGPVCGMGVCFECRAEVNGQPHVRTCQLPVQEGMKIVARPSRPRMADCGLRGGSSDDGKPVHLSPNPSPPPPNLSLPQSSGRKGGEPECSYTVAVIGAGPGGLAAAKAASEQGASVVLIDDNLRPGGQIWRADGGQENGETQALLDGSEADRLLGYSVVDAYGQDGAWTLDLIAANGERATVAADNVILATGAREVFLPFPGWTLPGVVGVGGLQAMTKNGFDVSGQRVVIAGSGPLLLAVAASLAERGAELVSICEQTSLGQLARFTLGLLPHLGKGFQGLAYHLSVAPTPYRAGTWVPRAIGDGQVEQVEVTDGKRTWRERCDILAVGYGLTPNTELARLMGCETRDRAVVVSEFLEARTCPQRMSDGRATEEELGGPSDEMRTRVPPVTGASACLTEPGCTFHHPGHPSGAWLQGSPPTSSCPQRGRDGRATGGVYAVGETIGIAGVDAALIEGRIAGLHAAGAVKEARDLIPRRRREREFAALLAQTFALRPEVLRLSEASTTLCRCEDVSMGALEGKTGSRSAKLHTRCGMGACQGRICGAARGLLKGWEEPEVRPPLSPVPLRFWDPT